MKKVLGLLTLCVSHFASAGYQDGKIDTLFARSSDNLHYVTLKEATAKNDAPACATHNYWMIKDENSVAGKTQISMLLAAHLANKKIRLIGANTCSRWGDGEDILYIKILD